MEEKAPSPQTTLLILLGASEWPQFPEFGCFYISRQNGILKIDKYTISDF
jgi:hypothetical protein